MAGESYQQLAAVAEKPPKKVADWTARWNELAPVQSVNGSVRERVESFAAAKGITLDALAALETRVATRRNGGVWLAWAGRSSTGAVTAVKYRLVGEREFDAERPSVWLEPLVAGKLDALDWVICEGETDAARLVELIGDVAVVLCLPAGARTWRREWGNRIPRGARVFLALDADEEGERGAEKIARQLGGATVRLRPPAKDWCAAELGREDLVALMKEAQREDERPFALPLAEFVAEKTDAPAALVGDEDEALLPAAGLLILFARGGKGKTTLTIDAVFHLASGIPWLGFPVERPLRVLVVENEGPREPFRTKLELKGKLWPHAITGAIHVATFDWGALTLKDATHVTRLRDYVAENGIELVVGDPLDSLGLEGVGSPEDTREFMRLLGETGLFLDVAWWLLAHARKETASDELDEISGAWGGRPDTMLMLDKKEGNRARLSFPKIRWSRRGTRPAYILAFDPNTETFSVAHEESEEERDYAAEIALLLADGRWRTAKEIAVKKDADEPGIGANVDLVKDVLAKHPDRFESRTGKAAEEVGRHRNATVWSVTRPPESHESHARQTLFARERVGVSDSVTPPIRESQSKSHRPQVTRVGTDSADSHKSGHTVDDETLTELGRRIEEVGW